MENNEIVERIDAVFSEKIQSLLENDERDLATEIFFLKNFVIECVNIRILVANFTTTLTQLLHLSSK